MEHGFVYGHIGIIDLITTDIFVTRFTGRVMSWVTTAFDPRIPAHSTGRK